jgi:hypothetical protein
MARTQTGWALALSLGLHAVPLTHAFGRATAVREPIPNLSVPIEPAAVLSGETFDIDAAAPAPPAPAVDSLKAPERAAAPASVPQAAPAVPAAPAATPAAGSVQTRAGGSPSSYGEDRPSVGAASLGKGLLRVLPRAAYPESTFHDLSYGTTLETRFSVELDEGGHALPPRFDERQVSEAWFDTLVVRALLLLRAGTFAVPASTPGKLEHAFELTAQVVEGTPASGDWLEPRDLAQIGRLVEPTVRQPGRAHFTYNSGREVRLTLRLVPLR